MKNTINKFTSILTVVLGLTQTSQAQQTSLWGSGYWGGQQGCSMPQQNQSQISFSGMPGAQGSDGDTGTDHVAQSKKSAKESKAKKYESEKALLEKKQDRLTQKIEKFFDPEISDFLLQTHFEKMNRCDDYRTYPQYDCASGENKSVCDGKDEVPQKLKEKWTSSSGGYCNANSNSNRGSVQSAICNDASLRPTEGSQYRSTSDCSQTLSDYRKNKMKLDQLQEKIERTQDEIADLEYASEEEKLNTKESRHSKTEGGCEECALAGRTGNIQKSNRDWWSTAANVVGGLGMIWYGKKIDESAQDYNAQLGYPSTNSYGYPFVNAGVSTLINGFTGSNGNCGHSNYSAFGYPQSYGNSYGNIYGSVYGNYGTGYITGYSNMNQLQQQLQAYNQIPVSQQTPDIQVAIAQLQARIAGMSSANYSYTSNYGLNSLYNTGTSYYPFSTTTGFSSSMLSGR